MQTTAFISGHLDLTAEEFEEHYAPAIREGVRLGWRFVVGDARGADARAQMLLHAAGATAVVFHMFGAPRNNVGFPTHGGFKTDGERDGAMTAASTLDIAWIRPGREKSGTARNLARRRMASGCGEVLS